MSTMGMIFDAHEYYSVLLKNSVIKEMSPSHLALLALFVQNIFKITIQSYNSNEFTMNQFLCNCFGLKKVGVILRYSCLPVFVWRRIVFRFFWLETIVSNFLHLMELFFKVVINHRSLEKKREHALRYTTNLNGSKTMVPIKKKNGYQL